VHHGLTISFTLNLTSGAATALTNSQHEHPSRHRPA
jgi:hypothetical protein